MKFYASNMKNIEHKMNTVISITNFTIFKLTYSYVYT